MTTIVINLTNNMELSHIYETKFNNNFLSIFGSEFYQFCILIVNDTTDLKNKCLLLKYATKNYYTLKYRIFENIETCYLLHLFIVNIQDNEYSKPELFEENIRNHFSIYEFDGSDIFTQNNFYKEQKVIKNLEDNIGYKKSIIGLFINFCDKIVYQLVHH